VVEVRDVVRAHLRFMERRIAEVGAQQTAGIGATQLSLAKTP